MDKDEYLFLHLYTGEGYSEPTIKTLPFKEGSELFHLTLGEEIMNGNQWISESERLIGMKCILCDSDPKDESYAYELTGLYLLKIDEPCFICINTDCVDDFITYNKTVYSDINQILITQEIKIESIEEDIDVKIQTEKLTVIGFQSTEGPYYVIIEIN